MACATYWSHSMTEHRVIVDALNIDYPAARGQQPELHAGNERLALVGESGSGKSCPPAP
jgi:peptide/nickel transport system ATP-binding protein